MGIPLVKLTKPHYERERSNTAHTSNNASKCHRTHKALLHSSKLVFLASYFCLLFFVVAFPRLAFMKLFWELQMDSIACIIHKVVFFLRWVGQICNECTLGGPWTIAACGLGGYNGFLLL
jgi:hypothetical protein